MRLQRIYSSKLYLTSSRKDKIHAAMQDPINAELVQQLSDYLDDTAQAELDQAIAQEEAEEQATDNADNTSVAPASSGSTPAPSGGSHSAFSGDVFKDFGGDDLGGEDIPMDEGAEEPAPEAPVEESTKTPGKSITAATAIIWTTLDDVVNDCETIKGTLNVREETNGVSRLQVKDNELWIFYNDDANLNDKMVEVIEVLNASGYTYLKFNRLARSNNAIVFDIGLVAEPMKSEEEIEDEK